METLGADPNFSTIPLKLGFTHVFLANAFKIYLQPDQINMAVLSWYLLKSDLSSVRYYTVAQ